MIIPRNEIIFLFDLNKIKHNKETELIFKNKNRLGWEYIIGFQTGFASSRTLCLEIRK